MGLVSPLASAMPVVEAVSVWPTCAVPVMVGAPVAAVFGTPASVAVGALVRVSSPPRMSTKRTSTLTFLPRSSAVRV